MLFTQKSEVDIHEMSPLALAFVGDAVLELLVRARLVGTTRLQPNRLHTVATHATVQEYRASTGFECLLGWLYLQGRNDRIQELFDALWDGYKPEQPKNN